MFAIFFKSLIQYLNPLNMSCVYLPLKRTRDMGSEHDADLNKLKEDLQRERERLEKLEKEVKEKMKQQSQSQNAWPRRQGR